jgi:hypothetical protein
MAMLNNQMVTKLTMIYDLSNIDPWVKGWKTSFLREKPGQTVKWWVGNPRVDPIQVSIATYFGIDPIWGDSDWSTWHTFFPDYSGYWRLLLPFQVISGWEPMIRDWLAASISRGMTMGWIYPPSGSSSFFTPCFGMENGISTQIGQLNIPGISRNHEGNIHKKSRKTGHVQESNRLLVPLFGLLRCLAIMADIWYELQGSKVLAG